MAAVVGAFLSSAVTARGEEPSGGPAEAPPQVRALIVGKALAVDPPPMQEIAEEAVKTISAAIRAGSGSVSIDAVSEPVVTRQQVRAPDFQERVTGDLLRSKLKALAASLTPDDTVLVYTHTHGRQAPKGGIVLDLPLRKPDTRGTTYWQDYLALLLELPARNVVVLTMSCFSGGLVGALKSPEVAGRLARWRERGRSLVVLTSQSATLPSGPVKKDGVVINPFTYAVARALRGEGDGFRLERDHAQRDGPDGRLTVGELIDYVLYTTRTTQSDDPRFKNTADPQVGGAFDRDAVLGFGGAGPRRGR